MQMHVLGKISMSVGDIGTKKLEKYGNYCKVRFKQPEVYISNSYLKKFQIAINRNAYNHSSASSVIR